MYICRGSEVSMCLLCKDIAFVVYCFSHSASCFVFFDLWCWVFSIYFFTINLYLKQWWTKKPGSKATTEPPTVCSHCSPSTCRLGTWPFGFWDAFTLQCHRVHSCFQILDHILNSSSKLRIMDISPIRWWNIMLKYHIVCFPLCCCTVVPAHANICEDSGFPSVFCTAGLRSWLPGAAILSTKSIYPQRMERGWCYFFNMDLYIT